MADKATKAPGKTARSKENKAAVVAKKAPPRKATRAKPRPPATKAAHPPARLHDSEEALLENTRRLLEQDREFIGRLIEIAGHPPLRRQEPGFAGMVGIIVSQQVSVASANAIFKRVETHLAPLSAKRLLEADDATLRVCGLSAPKMRALRALAHAVHNEGLDLAGLGALEAAA